MPYIPQDERDRLRSLLIGNRNFTAGQLNYLITMLLLSNSIDGQRDNNYAKFNTMVGVLECVKLEMYRRVIGPYEDLKINENGELL